MCSSLYVTSEGEEEALAAEANVGFFKVCGPCVAGCCLAVGQLACDRTLTLCQDFIGNNFLFLQKWGEKLKISPLSILKKICICSLTKVALYN